MGRGSGRGVPRRGLKGLGIAGALLGFAADPKYPIQKWVNVAGASAGAIMASYLAVKGDDAVQGIAPVLNEMPFAKFEDYPPGGRIVGGLPNLFRKHGMAHGEVFRQWLDDQLDHKTFAAVKAPNGTDSRLKVVAVDVTNSQLLVLPDDLPRYRLPGSKTAIDPDAFPISSAVRMSMSIPYFFEPVLLVRDQVRCTGRGGTDLLDGALVDRLDVEQANAGQTSPCTFEEIDDPPPAVIIDGGTLSNFPVWIFDVDPHAGAEGPAAHVRLHAHGRARRAPGARPAAVAREVRDRDLPHRRAASRRRSSSAASSQPTPSTPTARSRSS